MCTFEPLVVERPVYAMLDNQPALRYVPCVSAEAGRRIQHPSDTLQYLSAGLEGGVLHVKCITGAAGV